LLAASSLAALGRDDGQGRRRDAWRQRELQVMDQFAARYGEADFSIVGEALTVQPRSLTNPGIMSVFLSLGNVYLNRFEQSRDTADLDRSLGFLELVAGSSELWGKRPLAGSVVAYLGISVARLRTECGVSTYQSRIDGLSRQVFTVTAEEADAVAMVEEETEEFVATTAQEDAARAALYAAAAALLPEDPRATAWENNMRRLAVRLSSDDSQSTETMLALSQAALLYELSGKDIPLELDLFVFSVRRIGPIRLSSLGGSSPASDSVAVVEPGDSLENAIRESRVVATVLVDYLRRLPPRLPCAEVF